MADRYDQARQNPAGLPDFSLKLIMITAEIIIVGGGPAGSACALRLRELGFEAIILEKKVFPRQKICAGWITPSVFKLLALRPEDYPFELTKINRMFFYLYGIKIPVRTRQYAIRRLEFDQWMLSRTQAPVVTHTVKNITNTGTSYTIDDHYICKYLVGAGGTHCPVYNNLFAKENLRLRKSLLVAVEKEYQCDHTEKNCHIRYFDSGLPGYSWYLPKEDGWLNIGVGGKFTKLQGSNKNILDHWRDFIKKLNHLSFIDHDPGPPRGHQYYLFQKKQPCRRDNAFIIGDAAGLATVDMGEGIHGAIASGFMAAEAIAGKREYRPDTLTKFSFPGFIRAR